MKQTIFFDLDGTLADFYSVENWLLYLEQENPKPYKVAKPLVNMHSLARILNTLKSNGYAIGIISWGSKTSSPEYLEVVEEAKRKWLKRHLASVNFDEIIITNYGNPKEKFSHTDDDILFDDEERNRKNWNGRSYDVDRILDVLRELKR